MRTLPPVLACVLGTTVVATALLGLGCGVGGQSPAEPGSAAHESANHLLELQPRLQAFVEEQERIEALALALKGPEGAPPREQLLQELTARSQRADALAFEIQRGLEQAVTMMGPAQ